MLAQKWHKGKNPKLPAPKKPISLIPNARLFNTAGSAFFQRILNSKDLEEGRWDTNSASP
jgi:hypothetical protein